MGKVRFNALKINRAILELRYEKGYLYWDVCGKCILEINAKTNGKVDFSELQRDECILKFLDDPKIRGSFGVRHMTVSGEKLRNINVIKNTGPLILDAVKTHLKLQHISRAGFRLIYVYGTETFEEAKEFVKGLDLCSVDMSRFSGFGQRLNVAEPTFIVKDKKISTRICITSARRKDADQPGVELNENEPLYAVLVDIDSYIENVKLDGFDLGLFIHRSNKKVKDHIAELLNK